MGINQIKHQHLHLYQDINYHKIIIDKSDVNSYETELKLQGRKWWVLMQPVVNDVPDN
jgi:hypothetical protein